MDSHLLQSQRNGVYLAIRDEKLDPDDFVWGSANTVGDDVPFAAALGYKGFDGYHYIFDFAKGNHACRFRPGRQTLDEERLPGDWKLQLTYFREWLTYLSREIDALDLWAQTVAGVSAIPRVTEEKNTPLTPSEQQAVVATLHELRSFIKVTAGVTQEQLASIDSRLEYLEDAATRLGRKDWVNAAIGVVLNMVVGMALPPDTARDALGIAWSGLRWLMTGTPMLPSSLG